MRNKSADDRIDSCGAGRATGAPAHAAVFVLAAGVHACACGGRVILLDLRRDRYRAMDADLFEESGVVWRDAHRASQPLSTRGEFLLRRLQCEGLVRPASAPMANAPPARSRASADLVACAGDAPSIGLTLAWRAFEATTRAALRLRARRPDRIVHAVAARRAARLSEGADAANLARAFEAMRPWHPLRRVCLLDSLALIDFLAGDRIAADWVFGVRAQPFQAHCWVEAGHLVLNDALEHVRCFTPILRA